MLQSVQGRRRLERSVGEWQRTRRYYHVRRLAQVDGGHTRVRQEASQLSAQATNVDEAGWRINQLGDDEMPLPRIGVGENMVR